MTPKRRQLIAELLGINPDRVLCEIHVIGKPGKKWRIDVLANDQEPIPGQLPPAWSINRV